MAWNLSRWFAVHTAQEQFLTTSLSSLLVLKSCGFIQEQRAQIIDVSEHHLRLRLGPTWWQMLLGQSQRNPPLDVLLEFHPVVDPPQYAPQIPQSNVIVHIQSLSRLLTADDFHRATQRLMWNLRYHFLACS